MTDDPYAGRFEGGEHLLPVRVYYEDTDASGIVYHANYLRYCERGGPTSSGWPASAIPSCAPRPEPIVFVVRGVSLKFLRPARVDDALLVRTRYGRLEKARIHIHQQVERDGEVLCRAEVEVVCIHLDGRPARPPADMVDKLRRYIAPSS